MQPSDVTETSVTLTWDVDSGEMGREPTGYEIYFMADDGVSEGTVYVERGGPSVEYTLPRLKPETTYTVTVTPLENDNRGTTSQVRVTTKSKKSRTERILRGTLATSIRNRRFMKF